MSDLVLWQRFAAAGAHVEHVAELQARFGHTDGEREREGILADVLFHVQRRAKQLTLVAPQDPFAAAMLAEECLAAVQAISPESFFDLAHKERWAAVVARLHAVARPLADRTLRWKAEQVWNRVRELRKIHAQMGDAPRPEARIVELRRQRDALVARRVQASRYVVGGAWAPW